MKHGWILGPNSELLFWMPPINETALWMPANVCIIGEHFTRLDTNSVNAERVVSMLYKSPSLSQFSNTVLVIFSPVLRRGILMLTLDYLSINWYSGIHNVPRNHNGISIS